MEVDPEPEVIKMPRTINSKYVYVLNNPLRNIDPTGEFFINAMFYAAALFGKGEVQDYGRDWFFGEIAVLALIASGGTAAAAAAASTIFAGGDFGENFHSFYRISLTFLVTSTYTAPGGVADDGGNGLQGYIKSVNGYRVTLNP